MTVLEGKFKKSSLVDKNKCFPSAGLLFCKGISFLLSDLDQRADAISATTSNGSWSMCTHCLLAIQQSYSSCHRFGRIINRIQMAINFMWLHLVSHWFQCWLYGRIMREIWCQSLPMNATAHVSRWLNSVKEMGRERERHAGKKTEWGRSKAPMLKMKKKMLIETWKGKLELWYSSDPESHWETWVGTVEDKISLKAT